jgi:polyhydroxyalkanoate synthesis regulator phasin
MKMSMATDFTEDVFNLLKARVADKTRTPDGHFAEMDERELIAALGVGQLHVSKEKLRAAIQHFVETGQVSLEPGDSGFPNYDKPWGGANYHYRYHILSDTPQSVAAEGQQVIKGKKRITLPRFSRTEWPRVSIKFVGERNILLGNGAEYKPADFQSLGCADGRNGRPDDSWEFLTRLAKGGGMLAERDKKTREKVKKQKQKITDILRKIFENQTDPFEKERGGVYKARFQIEYLEQDTPTRKGPYSDSQEIFDEMTEPREEL